MGDHVLPWSALRHWGPAESMRFDPHPPPPKNHPGVGVLCTALDVETAVVETFGQQRTIDTADGRPKATS
ncbi:hypothetical protein GCM10027062_16780 [Nocardioides hungaricus]